MTLSKVTPEPTNTTVILRFLFLWIPACGIVAYYIGAAGWRWIRDRFVR